MTPLAASHKQTYVSCGLLMLYVYRPLAFNAQCELHVARQNASSTGCNRNPRTHEATVVNNTLIVNLQRFTGSYPSSFWDKRGFLLCRAWFKRLATGGSSFQTADCTASAAAVSIAVASSQCPASSKAYTAASPASAKSTSLSNTCNGRCPPGKFLAGNHWH